MRDPGHVVIDEFVGMLVTISGHPASLLGAHQRLYSLSRL